MNIQTKYPNQIIQAVGQAVAGLYGGELLCYQVVLENQEVVYRYECYEHGEWFVSDVKESDVATTFAYLL